MNIKIFISHSEKDKIIVSNFIDLLYDIGLKEENMFCSVRTEIGVPIMEDIYDYLRSILDTDNVIPIFMLSENFYNSPACLNEMGAVWIKQKNYFTFLLPGFEFKQIAGAINPNKKAIKLDAEIDTLKGELTNFKNAICKLFEISISENRWEKQRNEFIRKITSASSEAIVDISECRGYCIGEVNNGGCTILKNKVDDDVIVTYDFTKTKANICSVVFFMGEVNLCNSFLKNMRLCFRAKALNDNSEIVIELKLKNRDVDYSVILNKEWEYYSIPLQQFGGAMVEWEILREIKFLKYRNKKKRETIELKDIKIV